MKKLFKMILTEEPREAKFWVNEKEKLQRKANANELERNVKTIERITEIGDWNHF